MKSENLVELKRLRDTVAAARTALANLGSLIEHWDHIIVFIMFMKFSPETRREWNKTLGKSREYVSYEQIYDFLHLWSTYGLSEITGASDACFDRVCGKSCACVNSVSVPICVNCIGSRNLATCADFLSKSIPQHSALLRKKRVCLRSVHFTLKCPSRS